MQALIVHAYHEPRSFSSALRCQAESTLQVAGHTVTVSDLYAMGFDPVSDRDNFTSIKNADYLKQQQEEIYANEVNGFAADIEAEMEKLEQCGAVIFSFPLWWFGMPWILKGWCDRVLAMGRIYGGPICVAYEPLSMFFGASITAVTMLALLSLSGFRPK